jgi:hypothetical protein
MHCYVLTTIDILPALSCTDGCLFYKNMKRAWEHIIINHLQPNNCLEELILRFAMIMIVGSLQVDSGIF